MLRWRRIAEMVEQDDKRVQIAPLSNIVRLRRTKAGCLVTIGVPGELMERLARDELRGGLLLVEPAALAEGAGVDRG